MSEYKRPNISPKLRWRIFARDSFTCRYCGKCPPDVALHIDHGYAVSEGGTNEKENDYENLITACDGCNLGKGAANWDAGDLPQRPNRAPAKLALEIALSVRDEFPLAMAVMLRHTAALTDGFKKGGLKIEAAVLLLAYVCMRTAAFLWMRAPGITGSKRDFITGCGVAWDEETEDQKDDQRVSTHGEGRTVDDGGAPGVH